MIHDTPKPTSRKTSMSDRVLKNPITSLLGVILILGSFWGMHNGLDITYCTLIGVSGLGLLGIKDPRK